MTKTSASIFFEFFAIADLRSMLVGDPSPPEQGRSGLLETGLLAVLASLPAILASAASASTMISGRGDQHGVQEAEVG